MINNIRVIEKEYEKDGEKKLGTFVEFPMHKGKNQDGEVTWKPIAEFGNSKDEQLGKKVKYEVIGTVLEAYKLEERNAKVEKETDIDYDKDKVNAYIKPVEPDKIKGVGSVYYSNILTISPVFLKEGENRETGEKFLILNLEQRKDKDNNYSDVVFPVEKGLRSKINEACKEYYNRTLAEKTQASNENFVIEESDFYQELEEMKQTEEKYQELEDEEEI